jgi:hypothetical protein
LATNQHTGEVGEHWVLHRLIRAGYTAVLAPTNAKAVDILAADRDGKPFGIQVKTKRGTSKGWRLTKVAEGMSDPRLFYCLVDLGRDGNLEPPEVYIVPSSLIAHHTRMGHAEWLKGVRPDGQPRKDSRIRQILDPVPKSAADAVRAEFPDGWLERYKENWEILGTGSSIHQGAHFPKFAARSLRLPFNREKAGMGREDYSLVEGGKLKPGMLVLDIRGNAKNGSVPEGEGVIEEITNITPAAPGHNGQPYVKLHLKQTNGKGNERTKYLSTAKKVVAKAGGQFKGG